MHRLQVGDECYVRHGYYKTIYKCRFGMIAGKIDKDWCEVIDKSSGFLALSIIKGHKYRNNLVYPFPCVKELAQ
jgi:hypothetical protein